jgi:hypothetical protein
MIRQLNDGEKVAVREAIRGRIKHLERIRSEHPYGMLAEACDHNVGLLSDAWSLLEHAEII